MQGLEGRALNCRDQWDLIEVDFQELGEFSQKNNAFLAYVDSNFCFKNMFLHYCIAVGNASPST